MRLAFFVLDVATEIDEYTTTRLARAAVQGGHEVWYVGLGDVEHGEGDGQLRPGHRPQSSRRATRSQSFMKRIKESDAERIVMDDLDALFLRNETSTTCRSGHGQVHWVWCSARCSRLEG